MLTPVEYSIGARGEDVGAVVEFSSMNPKTENIINAALQLPREARALLAEKLLESLGGEEPFEVSQEWREEIERRCREIDAGAADLLPAGDVPKETVAGC